MNGQGMEQVSVWQVLVLVLIPLFIAIVGIAFRRMEKLQDEIRAVHTEDRKARAAIWERINENRNEAGNTFVKKEELRAFEERISKDLGEIKELLRTHLKAAV